MNYFTFFFALLIAVVCFWMSIKMIRLYLTVKKWNRVSATIISKEIFLHPKYSTSRSPYGLKVEYLFQMNNQEHKGHCVYISELAGGQSNHMKSDAERRLKLIEDTMLVYVNPKDVEQSVIYCNGIGLYLFVGCLGLFSVLIALVQLFNF